MRWRPWFRVVTGELLGSALLVAVMFASGAVRVQLGAGTIAAALLGSVALGLGHGLTLWSFGGLSGAQTNPLVTLIASAIGGQPWSSALARIPAQLAGAAAASVVAQHFEPLWGAGDIPIAGARGAAEAVASFGFVLVALGVAQRRHSKVPLALGAFATASFWMTGRSNVGNPLPAAAVLLVTQERRAWELLLAIGGCAIGAAATVAVAYVLFPRAREAASSLLFVPNGRR